MSHVKNKFSRPDTSGNNDLILGGDVIVSGNATTGNDSNLLIRSIHTVVDITQGDQLFIIPYTGKINKIIMVLKTEQSGGEDFTIQVKLGANNVGNGLVQFIGPVTVNATAVQVPSSFDTFTDPGGIEFILGGSPAANSYACISLELEID